MPTLVIGLGNPGGEYARTRHNLGWMVLDELERQGHFGRERREGPARVRLGSVDGFEIVTARPQTFMNESGRAGVHLVKVLGVPVSDVIVVYDDADIRLGRIRLRRGGSGGGPKGVDSLIRSWQTRDFVRLRVGIGRPPAGWETADHVLEGFAPAEREVLPRIIERATAAILTIIRDGLERAMAEYNRPFLDQPVPERQPADG